MDQSSISTIGLGAMLAKRWESVYVGRRGNGKVYYLVASTTVSNDRIEMESRGTSFGEYPDAV